MTQPSLTAIRNLGIISHIDAGKTTVSERILFYCGEIHRMGEVHEGQAQMDWMPQEQERGITITATAATCRWRDWWLNFIDTPGHIDFTIEVERSMRVLDGAIAIFSAVEGVQPQSESVWRQADRYRVPRICFINKMDRVGADPCAVLEQMRERLGARPVPVQVPVGSEGDFCGVIDLLVPELVTFAEADQGWTVLRGPVPAELAAATTQARDALVETAADFDDAILDDYLAGEVVAGERIALALRRGTMDCAIFPVLYGTALRNKGIQPLLDAVGAYLPAPLDREPPLATRPGSEQAEPQPCTPQAPLCALAFKVQAEEGRKLTYLRLYTGTLTVGAAVWNARRGCHEKVARLFRMHAHKREAINEASAGDIVAVSGFKEVLTGDTICAPDHKLLLAGLAIPEPVVTLAVEPKGIADKEKLLPALEKLQWEDPTFRVHEDPETAQTILTGMGELHLEVVVDRMLREYGVRVKTGRPQVMYRETLLQAVTRREVFHLESDGKPQHGEVLLRLAPGARGAGLQVTVAAAVQAVVTAELTVGVATAVEQVCSGGCLAGYPLTDVVIEIAEIPLVPGLTTDAGIMAAARRGTLLAAREARPVLLEPLMALEITTPQEAAGKVLGSLQQKRGRIEGMSSHGVMEAVRALVPLAEMFGYMTELRSATKGRGTFTMEFARFELAPPEVQRQFGGG
jgi:elongation factor G